MFKAYFWLTKPGIIMGNLISATGGFLFASRGDIDWGLLLATLTGTGLVIASGCVFNNYIDRGIDAKMARTRWRASVKGSISLSRGIAFGAVLGIAGFALLALFTNALTVGVGFLGYFFYLVMYSIWKRRSTMGTVVGSVSGATPILAGYVAVANSLDTAGLLLFAIMVLWQMPHFYAIAMYRHNDYAAAGLPVMPVKKGDAITKQYILLYIAAFTAAVCALTTLGYAGVTCLGIMGVMCFAWLWKGLKGASTTTDVGWAKEMFRFSLKVMMVFALMISIDTYLP
jgi:protoheme IX farnesyltransferase